ncbi:hypothetical protein CI109_102089 [Kwoniella shandongensis]|uniref:Mediator of RNA polymerase II transcription subunit 7 n=1 Tax=Kwoniella shandongensis TaxID=1734106 RepID=A0A5M6BQU8_9TREE|nr:uncharacterized protein CI109_006503 [Kwoniella shandongensis]KAA5525133.1 hypothetical protein CI109_006503 [Kwoniella shandongensis]
MNQDAALPITNTLFPPPPPYFQSFTQSNIERYEHLTGRPFFPPSSSSKDKGKSRAVDTEEHGMNVELNEEERKELEELEGILGRPRNDWVEEDGRWMCFGSMYTTEPTIPTAQSLGLPLPLDPEMEPQQSLPKLLHSFLHTVLLLLDTLTNTARTPNELLMAGWGDEGDQYVQHLSNLAAHMMVASNQLRGVQSEATLLLMMEKELAERRAQTDRLRAKCREIASGIKALKGNDVGPTAGVVVEE